MIKTTEETDTVEIDVPFWLGVLCMVIVFLFVTMLLAFDVLLWVEAYHA